MTVAPQTLSEVLDRISDGFASFDRKWRYTFINRAGEQFIDRTRESLIGRSVWEEFPFLIGTDLEAEYRRAAAGTEPVEFEMFAPNLGRWLSHRIFPSPQGVAVYFRDVTERHAAEEAIRDAESRWRAVFDNALEALFFTAPSGEIFAANHAAEVLLGRPAEEICRLGREPLVDNTDPRVARLLAERERNGRARGEMRMVRPDGTTFEAEVSSGTFLDAQGRPRTSLSIRDLSEQKRYEGALELMADAGRVLGESLDNDATVQNLTELIVPAIADICVVDLVRDNERVYRIGAARDEQMLPDPLLAPPGVEHRRMEPLIERVVRSGQPELVPVVTDEWLREASSTEEQADAARDLHLASGLVLPLIAAGKVIGVLSMGRRPGRPGFDEADVVIARGIADRAALAIDNASLYAETVRAKRAREEVLAIVSHDLRNPLNAVAIAAQLIAKGQDREHNLRLVQSAIARANRLVTDLLVASQLEGGRVFLELARIEPRMILDAAEALHRPIAEQKNITLRFDVQDVLPEIRVDRHRIEQVLANLIGNGIKFARRGGSVTVSARVVERSLVVSIADDGPGIPETDVPHLFERFWQGERAPRAGAGLGLAIAKGMVEAHGGRIGVESVVGSGTTFTFSLPLA